MFTSARSSSETIPHNREPFGLKVSDVLVAKIWESSPIFHLHCELLLVNVILHSMRLPIVALSFLFFVAACSEVRVPSADDARAMAVDASTARLVVNCRIDEDCSSSGGGLGATCSMQAPGGICTCDSATCNEGYDCIISESVCLLRCETDEDCNPGANCDAFNHCVPIFCSNSNECPAPYTCSQGALRRCQRPTCQPGTPECPENFLCSNDGSNVCIEQ